LQFLLLLFSRLNAAQKIAFFQPSSSAKNATMISAQITEMEERKDVNRMIWQTNSQQPPSLTECLSILVLIIKHLFHSFTASHAVTLSVSNVPLVMDNTQFRASVY